MNHEEILDLSKKLKCKVTDLIAQSPQNDPFYIGDGAQSKFAQWCADMYHEHYSDRKNPHARGLHYNLMSKSPPLIMPSGEEYLNLDNHWKYLADGIKVAKLLELIEPDLFDDRRNNKPIINYYAFEPDPSIRIEPADSPLNVQYFYFPPLPEWPRYEVNDYDRPQHYHIEIWVEKSSMNSIFEPMCQELGVNLVTGLGEMSNTMIYWLFDRIMKNNRPCRILYVSDHDPQGNIMPVAVSRTLEYYVRKSEESPPHICLIPVALTPDQCEHYQLPRSPIKKKDLSKKDFEIRFGEGATELDALEERHPGELKNILEDAIHTYMDDSLDDHIEESEGFLVDNLQETMDGIYKAHEGEYKAIVNLHREIGQEVEDQFAELNDMITEYWHAIRDDLEAEMPDIDDYPVPEPWVTGDEYAEALYDSNRDYLEQMRHYLRHKRKPIKF